MFRIIDDFHSCQVVYNNYWKNKSVFVDDVNTNLFGLKIRNGFNFINVTVSLFDTLGQQSRDICPE